MADRLHFVTETWARTLNNFRLLLDAMWVTETEMPSIIFACSDYRDFLRARYWELKEAGKKISFQQFSMRSKLSQSYLKLVLHKRRHLSLGKITAVATYLSVSERERQYLTFMILKQQAVEGPIAGYFESMLRHMRKHQDFDINSF